MARKIKAQSLALASTDGDDFIMSDSGGTLPAANDIIDAGAGNDTILAGVTGVAPTEANFVFAP